MSKALNQFETEEDTNITSNANCTLKEFLIEESVIREEKRLEIENEAIANEENEKYSTFDKVKENIKMEEDKVKKVEAEVKERRYKRLMHLLNSSKMYAVLLKNRIKEDGTIPRDENLENSAYNLRGKSLKKQNSLIQNNFNTLGVKMDTNENLEENKQNSSAINALQSDFFKETRVTSLGFNVSKEQPVLLEGGMMRDYQLQGLKWMINLFTNGVNGILADEMGLGKTIQVISFICYLIEINIKGPFLVVAPLSTVMNWLAEFKRFAPKVPTVLYHGSETERKYLLPKILQTFKAGTKVCHQVVITSYQIPIRDSAVLRKINWYYLIVDEGHRIKNHNSLLSRVLKEFNTIGRLLLTGTPLQNNLSELWSLLNFLLPEVFSSLDVFESWFDITELEKNGARFIQEKFNIDIVNILQEILLPFLLRREKKDVNLELPPKKEILIYCRMTQRQKELYQATIDRSIQFLLNSKDDISNIEEPLPKRRCFFYSPYGKLTNENNSKSSLLCPAESPVKDVEKFLSNVVLRNPQMQLRRIVNHPYLIHYPLKPGTEELRIDEEIVQSSGKLLVLDALLAKLKARGHKVVIFSFFQTLLDILEDYAMMRGYKYCRLDGTKDLNERQEEILHFDSNPDIFIFFASIRAGGLGINLIAADTVIFYDSDWNPQVNLQAQDRCHRIGQTKPVVVYTLCGIGTVDEKIIERGYAKRRLEKMILQKGKFTIDSKNSKKFNVMDLQELKRLLEVSDHDSVIKSNDFVLTDEELEALMDRSFASSDSFCKEDKHNDNKVFKVLNREK